MTIVTKAIIILILYKHHYKIIWMVRALLLVYKYVFIHSFVLRSTKMTQAIWLAVSKLWEFTVLWKKSASYIVFLFVKTKNNFIKEIKHVLRAFIAWWKTRQILRELSSRWKPSTASWIFTDLEFSQTFASVFTKLWRHGEDVSFLKWNTIWLLH